MNDVKVNKVFSISEVLQDHPDFTKELTATIWSNIKKSPNYKQLVNLNNRLENVEFSISKLNDKIDILLINGNGAKK